MLEEGARDSFARLLGYNGADNLKEMHSTVSACIGAYNDWLENGGREILACDPIWESFLSEPNMILVTLQPLGIPNMSYKGVGLRKHS